MATHPPEITLRKNAHTVEARHDGEELFRYVFAPHTATRESPRPCFHPLRTLSGGVVTGFRPNDHRWHAGLSMTFADVSGATFWGGPSYRDGSYVQLPNNGSQVHRAWQRPRGLPLVEELVWVTEGGERLFAEQRILDVPLLDPDAGVWALGFTTRLTNTSGRALELGSPTTRGRPAAGYGGLSWRGPRGFTGGEILTPQGALPEQDAMGRRFPWLAYVGEHDEVDGHATLLFVDDPANPRYILTVRGVGYKFRD